MSPSVIEIRGHHLLSIFYCFLSSDVEGTINYQFKYFVRRKQYGKEHAENMRNIMRRLLHTPEEKIKLLAGVGDDICRVCPKTCVRRGVYHDMGYDNMIIRTLGCEVNRIYALGEIIEKGKNLIEIYKKALPRRRGRPKRAVALGAMLAEYQSGR